MLSCRATKRVAKFPERILHETLQLIDHSVAEPRIAEDAILHASIPMICFMRHVVTIRIPPKNLADGTTTPFVFITLELLFEALNLLLITETKRDDRDCNREDVQHRNRRRGWLLTILT